MKKHIFAVGLLFAFAGCDIGGIRGNGRVVSEQRNVDSFVNVETGGAFRVEWNSGAPSASITVDENLVQYVEMEVRDTLKVSITGAGKVEYIGNPPHIQREITGAGSIRKREK